MACDRPNRRVRFIMDERVTLETAGTKPRQPSLRDYLLTRRPDTQAVVRQPMPPAAAADPQPAAAPGPPPAAAAGPPPAVAVDPPTPTENQVAPLMLPRQPLA